MRRALALLLVSSTAACGLLLGLEAPEGTEPPPATPTAADAAALPPSDPCRHASVPGPPPTDDAPAKTLPAFWLAVHTAGNATGKDLDGVCTCTGGAGAVFDGGASCAPRAGGAVACDEADGVDNGVRAWLGSPASPVTVRPEEDLARAASRGERTVLLRVDGYNGEANDRAVTVGIALADGLFVAQCDATASLTGAADAGPTCDGDGICRPGWRGCDKWHPLAGQTEGTTTVPVRQASGFVRDGVLVARLDAELVLPLVPGAATPVSIAGVLVTGRLEPVPSPAGPRFRLRDAVLGGRVPLGGLVASFQGVATDAGRLCELPEALRTAATELCRRADVVRQPALDLQPGVTCDAVSIGDRKSVV